MGDKPEPKVVNINGRLYDAQSGQPVAGEPVVAAPQPGSNSTAAGVSRANQSANNVHAKTQRGQTLNRSAVTKPAPTVKPTDIITARGQRATSITKSSAITKFGGQPAAVNSSLSAPVQTSPVSIQDSMARAGLPQPEPKPEKPRAKLFSGKSRYASIAATSLAVLLLVGYITYLNLPRMAMRVAAGRAGFEAQMPGYSPDGFRFSGPVSYSSGQITIGYHSHDDRSYTITERETNWDSQSLLDSYVEQEADLYSTYQERGLIVYIYDGSTATWVNGGIWYTVDSRDLTSEQLLKIAASL